MIMGVKMTGTSTDGNERHSMQKRQVFRRMTGSGRKRAPENDSCSWKRVPFNGK